MTSDASKSALTHTELVELGEFLDQVRNPDALSLEGMDGLFCALLAGPQCVSPGEYLPLLWGGALPDENVSFNVAQVSAMISLLMRHWNSVRADLEAGAVLVPLIFDSGAGAVPGRPWARGFMRGVNSSPEDWKALFDDESQGELRTISQMAGGMDTRSTQEPLTLANAKALIDSMAAGLARAFQYFHIRRVAPGVDTYGRR